MSAGEGWAPELAHRVRERARSVGIDRVGIVSADASPHLDAYRRWIGADHHGSMAYLARPDAVERRGDLSRTVPGVRSVIVVAEPYDPDDSPGVPDDPSMGVIARYARGRDYHKVLARKLRAIAGVLPDEVVARAYVDTGPILERDLARRAGLGWHGKNTMLIHPRRGSYCFLGVILVDVALPADPPFEADYCGSCRACLDACPTGALLGRDESGAPIMDARRCISYLTIEHRGAIPLELRPLMGNRVFGCDICQEVCPWNERFAEESSEPGYAARRPGERPTGVEAEVEAGVEVESARGGGASTGKDVSAETRADASGETRGVAYPAHPGTEAPSLIELLETALDEAAWDSFSKGSAIRRAGRAGFACNVCVGLGNWGSPEAVPVLSAALSDPEPLVRAHAAWALGRVGSVEARAAVSSRASIESDESVAEELAAALER